MFSEIFKTLFYAGEIVMNFYDRKEKILIEYKKDQSPVTNVDTLVSNLLLQKLKKITPEIPCLSEEMLLNYRKCQNVKKYWLIDPLDGTKEFLSQKKEFTINIALIKNEKPIFGAIFLPFNKILYYSCNNIAWKEKNGNKSVIKAKFSNFSELNKIVVSRSHSDKELEKYLIDKKKFKIKKVGSSLKFCLIAEGKAQIYPRFGRTGIWDTAAGHIISVSAGAKVMTWNKKPLVYSLKNNSLYNPGFIVTVFNKL
ncbi:3'(2'),5'-bisphosphate nucleotidase CysQ [Buchnera aphidicola (Mindarus keteleerifoliae)]|uniref:3'(2'),5'-bisphosphate nucleotidase CysQ n=1 Tax=Buchnera aphidicola TaxID=9 RepID=UPI0031B6979B